jgi:peroxiredoxin
LQGKPVPDCSLPSTGGSAFSISERFLAVSKVRGIERSARVIGKDGVRAREWRGVMVPGHVQEVSHFAKAL